MKTSKSIFIVDDDIFYSSILERHLENLNITEVEIFTEIDEAMKKIDQSMPKVIFLDFYLDNVITLDYLKKIKQNNPEIYIVVMTASEDEDLRKECYQCGAFYFLNKNGDLERNIAKIFKNVNKYSEHFQ